VSTTDLPARERPADVAPPQLLMREASVKTSPIRPCRLRQPVYPSLAEVIVDRVTLTIVAAMALMFIAQGLRALHHAGWF
jgi:hypothetical protein